MKVKRVKRLKGNGPNLKVGWLKIKSLVRRIKRRSGCKDKAMLTSKDSSINLNDVQDVPSDKPARSPAERVKARFSLKCRKKQLSEKETVNASPHELQDNMDNSIEWGNSEKEIQGEDTDNTWKLDNFDEEKVKTDDWIPITPKGQRNLGPPLMIEVLSRSFQSLGEPSTSRESETPTDESDKHVIVKPHVNSISIRSRTKHKKKVSSTRTSTGKNNEGEFTGNRLDISDSDIGSSLRKSINRSPQGSIDHTSNAKARNNLRPDKIGTKQEICDKKKPQVYCIRNIVIVIMESKSRFCFNGKLLVKVLYGAVKIYGFILDASHDATEVYSPRGYSSVTIETSEEFPEGSIENVWRALSTEGITRDSESRLQTDIDKIQPGTAVLILENFENNLTLFLKTYCPLKLFPSIKNPYYYSWMSPRRAEIMLQANLHLAQYDNFVKPLFVDPCVTASIAENMLNRWRANEWSCALIAGGKSVGKSTSVRCLINSLLRASGKVILLDVDPGQAECTPAGCISYSLIEKPLLGPNFTHLGTPIYQLFIEEISVSRCVTRYLTGIKMLIETLKACSILSRIPIVVNTMGFTQDIGWDLIIFTIKLIKPSIVLQIRSEKKKNNYIDMLSKDIVNKQECAWTFFNSTLVDWSEQCHHDFYTINSHAEGRDLRVYIRSNWWQMEPYQQRELVMISYLSGIVRDINDSPQYNAISTGLSLSINEAVPYTAPFSSLCIIPRRLFDVPMSHVLTAINGNIVALCGVNLAEELSQESEDASNIRVLTQRSPLHTCYGFGIIRGVDVEKQEIFINTPLPISMMLHVNCLAGCIVTPSALLQLSEGAPYVSGNVALPMSRELSRGYFRMRCQTMPNKYQ